MAVSVATGVIDLFLHPPLGLMRLEAIPGGPFSGLNSFTRNRPGRGVDAYGIRYLCLTIPDGYGITPSTPSNYADRQLIAMGTFFQLLDGSLVEVQAQTSRATAGNLFFEQSFPRNVSVELAPGVTANFWWYVVLP